MGKGPEPTLCESSIRRWGRDSTSRPLARGMPVSEDYPYTYVFCGSRWRDECGGEALGHHRPLSPHATPKSGHQTMCATVTDSVRMCMHIMYVYVYCVQKPSPARMRSSPVRPRRLDSHIAFPFPTGSRRDTRPVTFPKTAGRARTPRFSKYSFTFPKKKDRSWLVGLKSAQ